MNKLTPPERIDKILKYLDLTADAFGKKINEGKRSQVIYDIIKGKAKSITTNVISKIENTYPNKFNHVWLLTGTGEMLNNNGNIINNVNSDNNNNQIITGVKGNVNIDTPQKEDVLKAKEIELLKKEVELLKKELELLKK